MVEISIVLVSLLVTVTVVDKNLGWDSLPKMKKIILVVTVTRRGPTTKGVACYLIP